MIENFIEGEKARQARCLQLVASENLPSERVSKILKEQVLNWKTIEGSVGKRYHAGCEFFDKIEYEAIEACNSLFGTDNCLVQPISASAANAAVSRYCDKIGSVMAISARDGGHVSHSVFPANTVVVDVCGTDGWIDYDRLRDAAILHRPKVLVIGGSSYPREVDFSICAQICAELNIILWGDCAHIIGLIAGKCHIDAVEFCDIITASTYKTMRGPRSGFILFGRSFGDKFGERFFTRLNRSVFPGVQSSASGQLIAAKAIAFLESNSSQFKSYIENVIENAQSLAKGLQVAGIQLSTAGTDTHVVLCDLRQLEVTGAQLERTLSQVGILSNRNLVPGDNSSPSVGSGLRLGSSFLTSRGVDQDSFYLLGLEIGKAAVELSKAGRLSTQKTTELKKLVAKFNFMYPIPESLY